VGQVIEGIAVIAVIMAVGWIARATKILKTDATGHITDLVYWIAAPALLFSTIASADLDVVIGRPLVVAAASGVVTASVFALIARLTMRPTIGDLTVGAMSSSLNNAAYVGIPIAIYVLGSAVHGVPIMVFQLGFFTPMFFVLIDLCTPGITLSIVTIVRSVVTNPMVIAAFLGFLCAAVSLDVPPLIANATEMIGQSAPALVLISFGASLVGQRLTVRSQDGHMVILASCFKLMVQPACAFGAGLLLGMDGHALLAVTVMGAMPTAQNAFIASARAGVGNHIAQGTVLITTIMSLPVTVLIAWLFHLAALV